MDNLIPVNIVIGDRTYRIKLLPSDEEAVRLTIKLVNDKIIEFKTRFAGKDMQDYIAMVMIWYATQNKDRGDEASLEQIGSLLTRMEAQLGKID
jgi:hypothetical protein